MIRMARRRVMVLMTWLNMISTILKWFKPKQNIIQNSAQGVVAIMFCICALLGSPFWCWRTVVDVGDNDEDDHHLLYSCSVIFVFVFPPFLSATISAGIVCLCHGESLQRQKGFELGLGVRNNQLHPQRKLNRSLLVTKLPFFLGFVTITDYQGIHCVCFGLQLLRCEYQIKPNKLNLFLTEPCLHQIQSLSSFPSQSFEMGKAVKIVTKAHWELINNIQQLFIICVYICICIFCIGISFVFVFVVYFLFFVLVFENEEYGDDGWIENWSASIQRGRVLESKVALKFQGVASNQMLLRNSQIRTFFWRKDGNPKF